ncbi:MAG TPA: fumarylacetoacetate hydrolase family protein [Stellaceae bacterium]|nr:fumarylacetoacetate hydrolase family protein [Stellaceae bacterium]
MNGKEFKLATYAAAGGAEFAAIVLGDQAIGIAPAYAAFRDTAAGRTHALSDTGSLRGLVEEWDGNFPVLQELVAFIEKEGLASDRLKDAVAPVSGLRPRAPVQRPGKILNAAQNFQEHVNEMIRAGMSPADRQFTGEKATSHPYMFLKASSALAGAFDDVEIPHGTSKIDWEAELCIAIGRKAKRVAASKALEHIAGFMTGNDVSCRDWQMRPDRPGLRSDWYGGKGSDNFAPMGPYLVPRVFVADHMKLGIHLSVNGVIKQNGNTSQFIYTPEEQMEFASRISTLEPGDLFFCGTCGGVGQGTNTFLKAGDVMETEVEGLGRMRNRIVAERTEA